MGMSYGRDNLMVTAAHRYSLTRQGYIVSGCVEWLLEIWHELDTFTQDKIVKETEEALEHNVISSIDRQQWERLLEEVNENRKYPEVIAQHLTEQVTEGQEWAIDAYLHAHPNLRPEDLEIVQLQGNPFAYYVRAVPQSFFEDVDNDRLDATEVRKKPKLYVNRVEN